MYDRKTRRRVVDHAAWTKYGHENYRRIVAIDRVRRWWRFVAIPGGALVLWMAWPSGDLLAIGAGTVAITVGVVATWAYLRRNYWI